MSQLHLSRDRTEMAEIEGHASSLGLISLSSVADEAEFLAIHYVSSVLMSERLVPFG